MSGDNTSRIGAIGELPRDVAPAHDLWPGIARAIGAPTGMPSGVPTGLPAGAPAPRRLRPWITMRPWTAVSSLWALAAAVAFLAVGVWIGRVSLPAPPPLAAAADPATAGAVLRAASFAPDARFERTRERLLREVSARLAQLPPETRAKVEASLATVQRARSEIEQALGRDPGNALLQEMLVNSYQDEMRVLTMVREIAT